MSLYALDWVKHLKVWNTWMVTQNLTFVSIWWRAHIGNIFHISIATSQQENKLCITPRSFIMPHCIQTLPLPSTQATTGSDFCHCRLVGIFYNILEMESPSLSSFSLPSLSIILKLICVVARVNSWFLFIAKSIPLLWVFHSLCIHSPDDGHLDCFKFCTITDIAAMNSRYSCYYEQNFVWTLILFPF